MKFSWSASWKPPGLLDRLWYQRAGEEVPRWIASQAPPSTRWARLVPGRFVRFHERYARRHDFHWGACVLCLRLCGGHQLAGGVPDPTKPPEDFSGFRYYVGICFRCTRERNSTMKGRT